STRTRSASLKIRARCRSGAAAKKRATTRTIPRGSRSETGSSAAEDASARVTSAVAPQPLELRLRHVAVQHERREPGAAEPPRPRAGRDEPMSDEPVVVDAELALHPSVFIDFGIERAMLERRQLAVRPLEVNHRAPPCECRFASILRHDAEPRRCIEYLLPLRAAERVSAGNACAIRGAGRDRCGGPPGPPTESGQRAAADAESASHLGDESTDVAAATRGASASRAGVPR